jgi:hypothetical protein
MVLSVYVVATVSIAVAYYFAARLFLFPLVGSDQPTSAYDIAFEGIGGLLLVATAFGAAVAMIVWGFLTSAILRSFIAKYKRGRYDRYPKPDSPAAT